MARLVLGFFDEVDLVRERRLVMERWEWVCVRGGLGGCWGLLDFGVDGEIGRMVVEDVIMLFPRKVKGRWDGVKGSNETYNSNLLHLSTSFLNIAVLLIINHHLI